MTQKFKGTNDLFKAEVGDELGSIEFTITEEMVERNAWSRDDYNPWYMQDSPMGGRICPPLCLSFECELAFWRYYAGPSSGGGLWAKQEYEFVNPLKIGKKVRIIGKLVDRYSRRGRQWFVAAFKTVDEDDMEITRIKMTLVTPAIIQTQ